MKKILFVLVAIFLAACADEGGQKSLPVFDFVGNPPSESVVLNFTDMVSDIKIVPLETSDSVLLSYMTFAVNDKYIIVKNAKAMHAFDVNTGKHLKLLATAGNGPGEFIMPSGMVLKNNILTMGSIAGRDILYTIDLNDLYDARLQVISDSRLKIMNDLYGANADGELYLRDDSLLFVAYNVKEQRAESLAGEELSDFGKNKRGEGFKSAFVSQYSEESYFLNRVTSDTLYFKKESASNLVPFALFSIPEATKDIGKSEYYMINMPYMGSENYVFDFKKNTTNITEDGNGGVRFSTSVENLGLYVVNKKSSEAKIVKEFNFNPLFEKRYKVEKPKDDSPEKSARVNMEYFFQHSTYIDNTYYAVYLFAEEVKEMIEEYLESGVEITADKRTELENLNNSITEDSNPVVIIGKKK